MRRKRGFREKGFTLTEIVVVVGVIVILAAVSIPMVLNFIESGRQMNRDNIARTIYLAAQNRLTEKRITGRLDDFINHAGIDPGGTNTRVFNLLYPEYQDGWRDSGNESYVHFISLPMGYNPAGGSNASANAVLELLRPILTYQEILDNAVVIEFNIRTGVVLSVFYGDSLDAGLEFSYAAGQGYRATTNIRGSRAGYEYARRRSQGFYGVTRTGTLPEGDGELNPDTLSLSIIDSRDDNDHPYRVPSSNILFIRAGIDSAFADTPFRIELNPGGMFVEFTPSELNPMDNFHWALTNGTRLYIEREPFGSGGYSINWILDYVEGDTTGGNFIAQRHSIGDFFDFGPLVSYQARIINLHSPSETLSTPRRNLFFGGGSTNAVKVINSARHLFNIRYSADSVFEQRETIYLNNPSVPGIFSNVTNFTPIFNLSGEFRSTGSFEIRNLVVRTGHDGNAGLFEQIDGKLSGVILRNADIAGGANTGGITGINRGIIQRSGIELAKINGTNNTGGFVGYNGGEISDVYFISVNAYDDSPVTGGGAVGGITGYNSENGIVTLAFYFAPAPVSFTAMYPIVGAGQPAKTTHEAGRTFETTFYLRGHRHHMHRESGRGSWINRNYNFSLDNPKEVRGGGRGLVTNFIDLEWLQFTYHANMSNWWQPTSEFPYPILVGMRTPANWPVGDSPARPDQVTRDDWAISRPPVVSTVGFINSNFDMPLLRPGSDPREEFEIRADGTTSGFRTGAAVGGSRPNGVSPGGPYISSGSWGVYYASTWVQGWNTRPAFPENAEHANHVNRHVFELQRPSPTAISGRARTDHLGGQSGVFAELNADIPGTLYQVAPTGPGQVLYSFFHARRNDNGWNSMNFFLSGKTRNAYGNWEYTSGTTPSIVRPAITPRGNGLSNPRTRNTVVYGSGTTIAGDRPTTGAVVGRQAVPVTRVDFFDPGLCLTCGIEAQSFYNCTNPSHEQRGGIRNAFLIDTWVGNVAGQPRRSLPGQGQGITFWYGGATVPLTSNLTDSASRGHIPLYGVRNIEAARPTTGADDFLLPSRFLNAAQSNIIGYWDVAGDAGQFSEWKQYYGLVTIPPGQNSTEFAFQSNHVTAHEGNLLTGISLESPGLVTINNAVRMRRPDSDILEDVTFVQPGDELDIEMIIENFGEVPVNNINIQNRLYPFNVYIEYVPDSIRFNGGALPAGSTPIVPGPGNNFTAGIQLPPEFTLARGTRVNISFRIRVRDDVLTVVEEERGVSTLLYYFESQAAVSYFDAHFKGFTANNLIPALRELNIKHNASGPVRVFIDPIRLSTHVNSFGRDDLVDGPWLVNLHVENTLHDSPGRLQATGLINIVLPSGFRISQSHPNNLPAGTVFAPSPPNPDYPTRITVRDVNINDDTPYLNFYYTLEYVGVGGSFAYGVPFISSAEFRYIFSGDTRPGEAVMEPVSAMLRFPGRVVGLSIRTTDDSFVFVPPVPPDPRPPDFSYANTFEILQNDHMRKSIFDENYADPDRRVVLLDANQNPVGTNDVGNFHISSEDFTVVLDRTANVVIFTRLNPDFNGRVEFYYFVEFVPERGGGNPPLFNLSSRITKVEIIVPEEVSLYEHEEQIRYIADICPCGYAAVVDDWCVCAYCGRFESPCEFCPARQESDEFVCECHDADDKYDADFSAEREYDGEYTGRESPD